MKALVELLIEITTERLKKEQESNISKETIELLQVLISLGIYL